MRRLLYPGLGRAGIAEDREIRQDAAPLPAGLSQRYYSGLLLSGRLNADLEETDRAAKEQMELLTAQMAKAEGVTEALKASDQMEWVGRMNNIRSRAEEIVLHELVYSL